MASEDNRRDERPAGNGTDLLEDLPEGIAEQLDQRLSTDETPQLVLSTDITREGSYGESWLVATDKRLFILSATDQDPALSLEGTAVAAMPILEVPLSQIDTVETHEFTGTGILEIGTAMGASEELQFSRSLADKFVEAANVVEELVRQNKPEPTPEEQERLDAEAKERERKRPEPKPRCPTCGRRLPKGSEHCPACRPHGKLLLRMFGFVRPYIWLSVLSFMLSISLTVLNLAPPVLFSRLLDTCLAPRAGLHLTLDQRFHNLWILVAASAGVRLASAVVTGSRTRVMGWLGNNIMVDVRTQLYTHLQRLSLSFYDKKHLGSIMSRVTNDTAVMNQFIVDGLQRFMINFLTLLAIGSYLFVLNPGLAFLVVALPTPFLAFGARWFARKVHPLYRRYWRQVSSLNAVLASSVSGVRVVKGFAQEQRENRRFRGKSHDILRVNMRVNKLHSMYFPIMSLAGSVGSVIIWAVGGPEVLRGTLSIGSLSLFTNYMWQFYGPIGDLTAIQDQIQNTAAAAERVFEIMDTEPEVQDKHSSIDLPRIKGRVEFTDVSFRYESMEPGDYVLQDISFSAEPGELIGLVGHSGSGKTTLINLLLRFYDVTGGSVNIDGKDIRDVKLKSLRQQIGVVLQEPFLFSGTIAENIAYGRPDATREEIMQAAKASNAHRFIIRFTDGYDTEVGERGVRLSGGEKQRLSIARAILNNPRILILDEATSAVDTETERLIQEALDTVMKGRTSFAIAHRLSTLRNARKLIVLDKGKIVETGTHDELLALEGGVYQKLCKIQTDLSSNIVIQE
ncbi:MAG TPA: ABC transporter ATP-binding protein [Armatimonadota bacterium]|jgi:ATP-binding cassette subfamily B protein